MEGAAVETGRAKLVSRRGSEGWYFGRVGDGGRESEVPACWEAGLASFSALGGVEGLDLCGRGSGSVMG